MDLQEERRIARNEQRAIREAFYSGIQIRGQFAVATLGASRLHEDPILYANLNTNKKIN